MLNGLSQEYRISKQTEIIVRKNAKKFNYIPNRTAVSLRLKKTNTIGLIVPSLSNPFFSNISSALITALRQQNFAVILTDSEENSKREDKELRLLVSRSLDGLIIIPSGNKCVQAKELYNKGLPLIFVDRYFENSPISFVSTDNYTGAFDLTQHLINEGHKRIACIHGSKHVMPNVQRVKGYSCAMKCNNLLNFYIGGEDFTERTGYLHTKHLIQKQSLPTAIVALSDTIALGSLRALNEAKLKIPEDISLVTFDNSIYLDYLAPSITSIVQPIDEIADLTTKILIEQIEQKKDYKYIQQKILLQPKIVHRSSVRNLCNNA